MLFKIDLTKFNGIYDVVKDSRNFFGNNESDATKKAIRYFTLKHKDYKNNDKSYTVRVERIN